MRERKLRTGVPNKGVKLAEREQRHKDGLARQAAYNLLTTEQKIAKLDTKLGVGVGAKRQRRRLALTTLTQQSQKLGFYEPVNRVG